MALDMQVRPLGPWPGGKRTPAHQRKDPIFKHKVFTTDPVTQRDKPAGTRNVPVSQTYAELRSELAMIGCTRAVIEAGFRDQDIAVNGWPLSRARTPDDPGVVLRVLASKHGELTYPCDTFKTWEANLRAIMLALEALRKIDRYGVTKSGEQYRGWKQLPAQGTTTLTAQAAAALVVAHARPQLDSREAQAQTEAVLRSAMLGNDLVVLARKRTHPDAGGSTQAFQLVGQAWGVLQAHYGDGSGT